MSSDMEASFISVERINQYTTGVPLEASRETEADKGIGTGWPQTGHIVFKDVSLRYRSNLPKVLKGINLTIPGGSKVGVVGRTGSGKVGGLRCTGMNDLCPVSNATQCMAY